MDPSTLIPPVVPPPAQIVPPVTEMVAPTPQPPTPAPPSSPTPPAQPLTPPAAPTPPSPPTPPATSAAPPVMTLDSLGLAPAAPTGGGLAGAQDGEVTEMGLDDESVKAYDFELYAGRKGQTDRIAILTPNSIFGARIHFKQGAGYFLCQSKFQMQGTTEIMLEQGPCCQHLDPPSKRFAALIVQYVTTPDGNLMNPFGYQLKLWRFTAEKYMLLRTINKNYPLQTHDLLISCSEEKYQKLAIMNAKESVIRLAPLKQHHDNALQWAKSMTPKVMKAVGRKLTRQELLERLGLATAPAVMAGMQMPIADLSDLLPGGVAPVVLPPNS